MTARSSRKVDRILLLGLAERLTVSRGRLERDGCGDWIISARRGHISTDGSNFYAYLEFKTPRRWEFAKRTLNFLIVTQDGENEGIFIMRETLTPEHAAAIRKTLGLRKSPILTDQQKQTITSRLNLPPRNGAVSDSSINVSDEPTTSAAEPRIEENNDETDRPRRRLA
jgi:hypothetical protein